MKKSTLKKYAKLIAKVGANVQKGQDVIIFSGVDQELLTGYVTSECYKLGAKLVSVNWTSDLIEKINYKNASIKALSDIPTWRIEKEKYKNKTLPVHVYIDSSDPDAFKGIKQDKIAQVNKNIYQIMKPLRDERDNKYQWTIVGAASSNWAKKVFPELSKKAAIEKLWDAILYTSRCTDDPIKAWDEHNKSLAKHTKLLNELN